MTFKTFLSAFFIFLFLPALNGSSALADDYVGTLTGRIVAQEGGKPVPNAVVTVKNRATNTETQTQTDADGNFKVEGLRPGTYVVVVTAEKFETSRLTTLPIVTAGETTKIRDPIKLIPERAMSIIRGGVFDERGFSLSGAKVVIEKLSEDGKTATGKVGEYQTNMAGEFAFRLPGITAVYRVTVSAKGFQTRTQDVDVQKNEARNIAFSLPRASSADK